MAKLTPQEFQSIAKKLGTLCPQIDLLYIALEFATGRAMLGGQQTDCCLQTYDQPGHEGLCLIVNLLSWPIARNRQQIETFVAGINASQIPVKLLPRTDGRVLALRDVVVGGRSGYTDTKLQSLVHFNLALTPAVVRAISAMQHEGIDHMAATHQFGEEYVQVLKSRRWVLAD